MTFHERGLKESNSTVWSQRDWEFIAKQPASAPHMLRIVPHTVPRVGRSDESIFRMDSNATSYPFLVFYFFPIVPPLPAPSTLDPQPSTLKPHHSTRNHQSQTLCVDCRPRSLPLKPAPKPYRGTSLITPPPLLGPYRRPMPRVLGGSWEGGRFLVIGVPL